MSETNVVHLSAEHVILPISYFDGLIAEVHALRAQLREMSEIMGEAHEDRVATVERDKLADPLVEEPSGDAGEDANTTPTVSSTGFSEMDATDIEKFVNASEAGDAN